jgi:DNA-binding response OmpR family regulator
MEKVLVIEDEDNIRDLIIIHLKREGFQVDAVASAEEAFSILEKSDRPGYSVFIVDWMLPGQSGIELIKWTRERWPGRELSLLMLTARAETKDIIEGLEAGADDFVTKPFDMAVLIARVRAAIRRQATRDTSKGEALKFGDLQIHPELFECECAGQVIQLTPSEYKLLVSLVSSSGRVLTRDSLISNIQGNDVNVTGRTVDTHVFTLRKKLGDCASFIETVRGIGYRIK